MTDKKKILIFCGNGYIFDEIYRPIIDEVSSRFIVDILLGDYYLTGYTLSSVERFIAQGKINSFRIIKPYKEKNSFYKYHKGLKDIIQSIKGNDFDVLLLGSDTYLIDRYLIHLARMKKAVVIIIQSGQMVHLLDYYRKIENKEQVIGLSGIPGGFFKAGLKRIRTQLGRMKRDLKHKWYIFQENYFFSLFVTGRIFPYSKYDIFSFTSGRGDIIVCYDVKEIEALKRVIPRLKGIRHARHPAAGINKDIGKRSNKLLVSFSGCINNELEEHKIERWIQIIRKAVMFTGLNKVHLRFHPRTSRNLMWPKKIYNRLLESGYKVEIIDALEVSFVDSVSEYAGVIGAPSGALRAARAVCPDIFIVGVPNCGDPAPWEQSWVLGDAEGISWVDENGGLEQRHLEVLPVTMDNRPKVSDILQGLINREKCNSNEK